MNEPIPDSIRYQLIHRKASTVLEAVCSKTDHALMIVHSFSPENRWFDDYAEFVSRFGKRANADTLVSAKVC